jgi:hypothetical protein
MCGLRLVGYLHSVVVGCCGFDGYLGCVDVVRSDGCDYCHVGVFVVALAVAVVVVVGGARAAAAAAAVVGVAAVLVVVAVGCSMIRCFFLFPRGEVVVEVASSGELVCVCASPKVSCQAQCVTSFLALRLGSVCARL